MRTRDLKSLWYDKEELIIFTLVIALSVVPMLFLYLRTICT